MDLHDLVVRSGIVEAHEVPQGWGLLEWAGDGSMELSMTVQPNLCAPADACRLELLLGIARTATRWLNKHHGLPAEVIFRQS